ARLAQVSEPGTDVATTCRRAQEILESALPIEHAGIYLPDPPTPAGGGGLSRAPGTRDPLSGAVQATPFTVPFSSLPVQRLDPRKDPRPGAPAALARAGVGTVVTFPLLA